MKKGITLFALLITIIVAIILAGVAVASYSNIFDTTKKSDFAKEMYSVLKLVNDYNFFNGEYPTKGNKSIDLTTIDANNKQQFSSEPGYASNTITLGIVDLSKAGAKEVKRGNGQSGDDIYLISNATGKMYYLKGETIAKKKHYTLTDELLELIDIQIVQ